MKTQSVHEVGTMKYFQERTMRHDVYSDIKKDVNGFQDFFLSVGRAYLAAAFTEYFTIDSSTGKPTAHIPPPNIKEQTKWNTLSTPMAPFLIDMFFMTTFKKFSVTKRTK